MNIFFLVYCGVFFILLTFKSCYDEVLFTVCLVVQIWVGVCESVQLPWPLCKYCYVGINRPQVWQRDVVQSISECCMEGKEWTVYVVLVGEAWLRALPLSRFLAFVRFC